MMVSLDHLIKSMKKTFNRIFNPTLTKNMKHVKWDQIPPVRGPNPQGLKKK
jgi:hypothetical protein